MTPDAVKFRASGLPEGGGSAQPRREPGPVPTEGPGPSISRVSCAPRPDAATGPGPAVLRGWAGPVVSCYTGACPPRQERVPSPALLADAGQLGPGGVEVALGTLGPGAQLAA